MEILQCCRYHTPHFRFTSLNTILLCFCFLIRQHLNFCWFCISFRFIFQLKYKTLVECIWHFAHFFLDNCNHSRLLHILHWIQFKLIQIFMCIPGTRWITILKNYVISVRRVVRQTQTKKKEKKTTLQIYSLHSQCVVIYFPITPLSLLYILTSTFSIIFYFYFFFPSLYFVFRPPDSHCLAKYWSIGS